MHTFIRVPLLALGLVSLFSLPPTIMADASETVVFDDMEHGDPFGNGWFVFNGSVGGGGIAANSIDPPPVDGGSFSLDTGWGSGGTPGFYGGFGRTQPLDLGSTDHFNFWINPDAGQEYTLEINLQDDDNGDGAINPPEDDEFQFNCVVSATGPCATSGGGWQLVSIPLADFFDDNSFLNGGNGTLDAITTANGGNGGLVNVVWAIIGSGSDVSFRTDYWAFSNGPLLASQIVDDFESGLPFGADANGSPIGFYTFNGASSFILISTTNTALAVPGSSLGNQVLQMDIDSTSFAGFIHAFEDAALSTWVPEDWSTYEGLRFWLFGQNTGTELFVDVLDNRNPGSITDDAERYTVAFADDFSGWQLLEFPFSSFVRKEIGNGAPNDGFNLTQVHGWALGTLGTGGPQSYFVDDAELYGEAQLPDLEVGFTASSYPIEEGATGLVTVSLNRPLSSSDPVQVSVDYTSEPNTAIPDRDYIPVSGTLTFVNGGPTELTFTLQTLGDNKWQGSRNVNLVLSNAVDTTISTPVKASVVIIDDEVFDPNLLDDFEKAPALWDASGNVTLSIREINAGETDALPGQDSLENVLQVSSPLRVEIAAFGNYCKASSNGKSGQRKKGVVPVVLFTTGDFDALSVDHTTVTFGNATEAHVDKNTGLAHRHEEDADGDGDIDLVFHFPAGEIDGDCGNGDPVLTGLTLDGQLFSSDGTVASFGRDFAIGQDWSTGEALSFWYYGSGSGATVNVQIKDNRAPDPGPSEWSLVWNDEFDGPAGAPANPENWSYEIGDIGTDGTIGWGNDELQYYTDGPANAATDGNGNLLLTAAEADGSLTCYYGPCDYSSARLTTKHKAEFAYGRIEARIKLPDGEGLDASFWSLGSDIDRVSWPQAGEIDFIEYVGRLPNDIFGTINGPGYSGGNAFGDLYSFGEPASNEYHTYTVEWQPDEIRWYVDGILYHSASPADVAPNEWVFDNPVFLLLSVSVGGNFAGPVDPAIVLPQSMAIDYVRVYQAPDTAERFETSFVDDVAGWQQITLPFAGFTRGDLQPVGAPDDGLTLTEIWGYGLTLPQGGTIMLDQVRLEQAPPPLELVVTTADDNGAGSLRQALQDIAVDGSIRFDPALAGATIVLNTGQLYLDRNVTVDGADAPGLTISGNGASRVLFLESGTAASINDLILSDGAAAPQGGGILNFGNLTLDRVTVSNNTETSAGPANFAFGGGGIYNGDGATLNLIDSTVSNNVSTNQPGGGIYGFFNSNLNIIRSTISDNSSGDVAGGLRTLGDMQIENSTITGNTSTAWHGGGAFITDGTVTILNSTISNNFAPPGTAGGLMIATFGAPVEVRLVNSIVSGNSNFNCQREGGGGAVLTSDGYNIASDFSCGLTSTGDQENTNPLLDTLADNGGPTLTQALQPGSPAIDAADSAACPLTDQRGEVRPLGECDIGAFEF